MKHKITILWGDGDIDEVVPPRTYEYSTAAELAAFIEGLDEAINWNGYEIVEENNDAPKQCECGVLIEQHRGLCSDCLAEDPELQEMAAGYPHEDH